MKVSKHSLLQYPKNPKVQLNWRTKGVTLRFLNSATRLLMALGIEVNEAFFSFFEVCQAEGRAEGSSPALDQTFFVQVFSALSDFFRKYF